MAVLIYLLDSLQINVERKQHSISAWFPPFIDKLHQHLSHPRQLSKLHLTQLDTASILAAENHASNVADKKKKMLGKQTRSRENSRSTEVEQ